MVILKNSDSNSNQVPIQIGAHCAHLKDDHDMTASPGCARPPHGKFVVCSYTYELWGIIRG